MTGCFSASVGVGFDLAVRGGSRLACQRRPRVEENCWEIGNSSAEVCNSWCGLLSGPKLACKDPAARAFLCLLLTFACVAGSVRVVVCLCPTTLTKWFYPTRLETRTKESSICASAWVIKPTCKMKVTVGICAPTTDQST